MVSQLPDIYNQNLPIMKKLLNFIKKIYTGAKNWIVANDIEGVLGLTAGLLCWSFGYKIAAGFAFGVFATRNWDLVKKFFTKSK